jgi:hypothetical protein
MATQPLFHPELHPALQNNQRGAPSIDGAPRAAVVRAVGFEPTTYGLEVPARGLHSRPHRSFSAF